MSEKPLAPLPERFMLGAPDEIKNSVLDIFRFINSGYEFDVIFNCEGVILAREISQYGYVSDATEMAPDALRRYRRRANWRRTSWTLLPEDVRDAIVRIATR